MPLEIDEVKKHYRPGRLIPTHLHVNGRAGCGKMIWRGHLTNVRARVTCAGCKRSVAFRQPTLAHWGMR